MLEERFGGIAISPTTPSVAGSYSVTTSVRFPRVQREIGLRRIDELVIARQHDAGETVAGAQSSQVPARVAVDEVCHAVGHVRKHKVVDPYPVFRCGDFERRHLGTVRGVRRKLCARRSDQQHACHESATQADRSARLRGARPEDGSGRARSNWHGRFRLRSMEPYPLLSPQSDIGKSTPLSATLSWAKGSGKVHAKIADDGADRLLRHVGRKGAVLEHGQAEHEIGDFIDGDGVRVIDFDDAGFGWHLFELATSLYFITGESIYPTARDALIRGYRSERALPAEALERLPLFLAARGTTYLGWVHTRQGSDTARETDALSHRAGVRGRGGFLGDVLTHRVDRI